MYSTVAWVLVEKTRCIAKRCRAWILFFSSLVLFLALMPFSVLAVQTAAPSSDVTVDTWVTAPLYDKLDEASPDDTTTEITNGFGVVMAAMTRADADSTSVTVNNHPVTGTNRLLLVTFHTMGNVGHNSVTFGSLGLTKVNEQEYGSYKTSLWRLYNPVLGTSNVVATAAASCKMRAAAFTFQGVDQGTSVDGTALASGDGNNGMSVNVTSEAGDLVFDAITTELGGGDAFTVGADQTAHYDDAVQGDKRGGSSRENGKTTTAMSWSWSSGIKKYSWCGLNINAHVSTNEVKFAAVTDPVSSSDHLMKYCLKQTGSGALTTGVFLVQGTTVINTSVWDHALSSSYTSYTQTLTSAEANAISDYSDLRVRFVTRSTNGTATAHITWAQFECPDAGGASPNPPAETNDYMVVYELSIPTNSPGWNGTAVAYSIDNSTNIPHGSFPRTAYYMEAVSASATQWVYVSMASFTTNAAKTGVPNVASGELYHYGNTTIANANIYANVVGITTGTGIETVNLEFWPSNYNGNNDEGVPNADGGSFDFGDGGFNGGAGYGSMQIHNYGASEVLFAVNDWGNANNIDFGFGNRPSGNKDWTFDNANVHTYITRTLQVLAYYVPKDGIWTNDDNGLWSATSNWDNASIAVGPGQTACFTNDLTADRTVSVDYPALAIGNLIFGSSGGNWIVNSNSINLTNSSTPVIAVSNNTATINSVISGFNGFDKTGAGTLIFSGANTLGGNMTVSAGTLKLGAAGVIPDGTGKGNLSLAGTLDLATYSETINGLSGAGTVDNSAAGTPTLTVGANNQTSTFSGVIQNTAGTLAFTKTGTEILTLSGANTYGGKTTVSAGELNIVTGGSVGSSTNITVEGNARLTIQSTAGVISDTAAIFVKSSGGYGKIYLTNSVNETVGTLYFDDESQFAGTWGATGSGATYIDDDYFAGAGVLTVMNGPAQGDGSWDVDAGGIWSQTNNWTNQVIAFGLDKTAYFTNDITADWIVTNNYQLLDIGNFVFGSSSYHWTLEGNIINLTNSGTPEISVTTNTATISSILSGVSGFDKTGPGTLILNNTNSYSGETTVSAGTLRLAGVPGLGEGQLAGNMNTATVNPATNLVNTTTAANVNTLPPWAGDTTFAYSGYVNNTNSTNITWTFAENVDDKSLLKIDGVTLLNDAAWDVPTKANYTLTPGWHMFEARFSNGGGGAGYSNRDWLDNNIGFGYDPFGRNSTTAANYQKMIDPGDCSLFMSLFPNLPTNTALTIASGAILDLISHRQPVFSLSGSGTITNTSLTADPARLLVGADGSSSVFSGVLSGPVALTKQGSGVLDLADATLIQTGDITVSGGQIRLKDSLVADNVVISNQVNNGVVFSNATTFSIGTLGGTGSISLANTEGSAVTLLLGNMGGTNLYSGALTGSGSVVMEGSDTVGLTGNSTYSGGTIISNGTLAVGGRSLGSGTVTIEDGATLSVCTNGGLIGQYFNGFDGSTNHIHTLSNTWTYLSENMPAPLIYNSRSMNFDPSSQFPAPYDVGAVNFWVYYSGKIYVSSTASYTFQTRSDDGSMLWIDGTNVVYNNYFQGMTTRGGLIDLDAGLHDIVIAYYQGGGGYGLNAWMNGAVISSANMAVTPDLVMGALAGTGAVELVTGSLFAGGNNASTEYSGTISGSGGLYKTGTGILTNSSVNTYNGDTIIYGGTMKLTGADKIPDGAGKGDLWIFGLLDLASYSETINSLSGNGVLDSSVDGTVTLTINHNGEPRTFNGDIRNATGTVSLVKTGSGIQTFGGGNTYSGDTTISAGTLRLTSIGRPGLYEGRLGNNFNTTSPNPATSITNTTRMAATNAKPPWGDNETWVYTGYVNNPALTNVTWTFAENIDDNALLKIDGVTVLNNGTWNVPTKANYTLTPGWHIFEARFGNGGGGAGLVNADWFNNSLGFGYDPQGRNSTTAGNYQKMIDPGNGSLFMATLPSLPMTTGAVITVASGATLDVTAITNTTFSLVNEQILTGNGTVSGNLAIVSGTFLTPGGSNTVGSFTVSSNLTFTGGTLMMDIDDTNDCDQILMLEGNLILGDGLATLHITCTNGYGRASADKIWLVNNSGAGSISGYFDGLPPNGSITVGTNEFCIFYGGDYDNDSLAGGNDIVLGGVINNSIGATNVFLDSADLYGYLISTSGVPTDVYVFWGTSDGGTNYGSWDTNGSFGTTGAGILSTNVTGLIGGTDYFYRFYATNSLGEWWAPTSVSFSPSQYKMKIYFTGYDKSEILTNFPALITFDETISGFDYNQFGSTNGWDLRFYNSNSTVRLSYEIEKWETNGTSYVWVRVPELVDDGWIWAYWGGADQGSPEAYTVDGSTWASDFLSVWHMAQTNTEDSTANSYDGTAQGTVTLNTSGKIGNSVDLDADTDYVAITKAYGDYFSGDYSVSAWIKVDPLLGEWQAFLGSNAGGTGGLIFGVDNSAGNYLQFWSLNGWRTSDTTIPDNAWKHVAYTRSGTDGNFYVDGVNVKTRTDALAVSFIGLVQLGGGGANWPTNRFDGNLDEIRMETAKRSANWMYACFMNQSQGNNFTSNGPITSTTAPVIDNASGASGVTLDSATLNGYLATEGASTPIVIAFWGTSDGGTNYGGWEYTNVIDSVTVGALSTNTTAALATGTKYYYRYYATNSYGQTWAPATAEFSPSRYRMKITFSGYDKAEILTNFPALVTLNEGYNGFSYSQLASGTGGDLRFQDSEGTKFLNYEVDTWNTNGNSYIWVQVPALTNNAWIWAYWGNENDVTPPAYTMNGAAWNSGYRGVWHLDEAMTDEGVTGNNFDSTANGFNGLQSGNDDVPALIGGGQEFDGNDRVILGSLFTAGAYTKEIWVRATVLSNIMSGGIGAGDHAFWVDGGYLRSGHNGSWAIVSDPARFPYASWQHVSVTYDSAVAGGTMTLYRNGVQVAQATSVAAASPVGTTMALASHAAGNFMTGRLDEGRFSSKARSANWLWATYLNMASNSMFNVGANVETVTLPVINNDGGVTNLVLDSAILNGYLAATGGTPATVSIFWGTSDGGTNQSSWDTENIFPAVGVGLLTTNLVSLSNGVKYYYRYFASNSVGESWSPYTTSFTPSPYKMKITFSGYNRSEALTNFPALVVFNDDVPTFDYRQMGSTNGYDLRFQNSNETAMLNYEIEQWNTNGSSYVWVRVPELVDDGWIWAYWGSTNETAPQAYTTNGATWSSEFTGVWHLNSTNAAGRLPESTITDADGINTGTTGIQGMIAGAKDFVRAEGDWVNMPVDAFSRIGNEVTISVWTYGDGNVLPGQATRLFEGNSAIGRQLNCEYPWNNNSIPWDAFNDGTYDRIITTIGDPAYIGGWKHVVFTKNRVTGIMNVYLNGTLWFTGTGLMRAYTPVYVFSLGSQAGGGNYYWDGSIDEFRVSNVARSSNWVWACYLNQSSYNTFIQNEGVQSISLPVIDNDGGASNVVLDTAVFNGYLSSTGGAPTTVSVFWGTSDGGTNKGGWDTESIFPEVGIGLLSTNLTPLVSATKYYYRYFASNAVGECWAPSSASTTPGRYKMKVKFTGYNRSETLTNYPALVALNESMPGFFYGQFGSASGYDLRFQNSNETVILNYEIEEWNTNGESLVWVQVPEFVDDGWVWAYWGSPNETAPPAYTTNGATWTEGFLGVWHLNDDTKDSTGYHMDGFNVGSTNCTGVTANGQGFNDDDYIRANPGIDIYKKSFMVSAWAKRAATGADDYVIAHGTGGVQYYSLHFGFRNTGEYTFAFWGDDLNSAVYPDTDWHYWAGRYVTGTRDQKLYRDAVQVASRTSASEYLGSPGTLFRIGERFGDARFNGLLDEVRVENVARSTNWIYACWMGQLSNSVFVTTEPVKTITVPVIFNVGATNVTTYSADVLAYLSSTGGAPTTVTLYWGTSDGGTNYGDWDTSIDFGTPVEGLLATNLPALASATNYYYRYYATNSIGECWAPYTRSFAPFRYKMKITFDGYNKTEPLTNFPALVVLNENTNGFSYYQFASTNGYDLRFNNSNDTVVLNYEVEEWDTSGDSFVWVKVPELVDGGWIWAYWGSLSETNQPAYTTDGSTWSEGYKAVWHLEEASGTRDDSTAHQRDGTAQNNPTASQGIVSDGVVFNGVNSWLDIPNNFGTLFQNDPVTVSMWIKPTFSTLEGGNPAVFSASGEYSYIMTFGDGAPANNAMCARVNTGAWSSPVSVTSIPGNDWTAVTMTYDPATGYIMYKDGQPVAVNALTTARAAYGGGNNSIGSHKGTERYFGGVMDEMRISSVARSSNWVWACWVSHESNSMFNVFDSVQSSNKPVICNMEPTTIGGTNAVLNGYLVSTGGAPTTVTVYWGTSDGGTNAGAWDYSRSLGASEVGALSTDVREFISGVTYYYRFHAVNAFGESWGCPVYSFKPNLNRMKITFSGYDRSETLTNFPALVKLGPSLTGFDYSGFTAPLNGGDLRFANSNETVILNYEIEHWENYPANPSNLPGLKLWLKADAGVQADVWGRVTNWVDQSGCGHDAWAAAVADAPTRVANSLNGNPIIRFDGVTDYLRNTAWNPEFNVSGQLTIIFVSQVKLNADWSGFFAQQNNGNDYDDNTAMSIEQTLGGAGGIKYYRNNNPSIAVERDNSKFRIDMISADASGTRTYLDGAAQGTSATAFATNMNPDEYAIAARLAPGLGTRGEIDFAEIIIYNHALTVSERNQVGWYLSEKYDLDTSYTEHTGNTYVWVQVPEFVSDGWIWAYWGSSTETNPLPCTTNGATWSSDYLGVYHLNDSAHDSSANRYDGVYENGVNYIGGISAGGIDLAGGAHVDLGGGTRWDPIDVAHDNAFTLSTWVKHNNLAADRAIFGRFGSQFLLWMDIGGGLVNYVIYDVGGPRTPEGTGISARQDAWQQVVATGDGTTMRVYVDGVLSGTNTGAYSFAANADKISLGTDHGDATSRPFDGSMDEARIAAACFSSNWIWATWMNMASNSIFLTPQPDYDSDGDGVSDTDETIAGTDPGDSNSCMRIVSGVVTNSSDLMFQIAVGSNRTVNVLAADSDSATKIVVGSTTNSGLEATNVWIDVGAIDETDMRLYNISVNYLGSTFTHSEEWAVHVQNRQSNELYMICVPVDYSGAGNNLNSVLGDHLALGLHADANPANADKIRHLDAASGLWTEYYLDVDGWHTNAAGFGAADVTVAPGMGFQVSHVSGARSRTNAVFVGRSWTESVLTNTLFYGKNVTYSGWNMFGWPLAATRSHSRNRSNSDQLGFWSAGANGGGSGDLYDPPSLGDQIWLWRDGAWRYIWLIDVGTHGVDDVPGWDARWWDEYASDFANFTLEPGKAYYYYHTTNFGGTNFWWKPELP